MSSAAKIQSALEKAFARQRVVFWYDETSEWWTDLDSLDLPGVEKLRVTNNELGIKHRITREQPQQRFLLYFQGQAKPHDHENWLLDQLLANGPEFSPDRASLALIEAELAPEFKPLVERHLEFFKKADRISKLRELQLPDDCERDLRIKMLAVACKAEPNVEVILLNLLGELAREKQEKWSLVEKFGLASAWWSELEIAFGYSAANPGILDFTLSLFRAVAPLGEASTISSRQALVFANRWKDSQEHRESFSILSERVDGLLNISAVLNRLEDTTGIFTCDIYRRMDLRILADLRDGLIKGVLTPAETRSRAESREQLHWARHTPGIKASYRALATAAEFFEALPKLDLVIESFDAGISKYTATWWQMDRLYRQFVYHLGESGQNALLQDLSTRMEGLYVNNFLSQLSIQWQEWVNRSEAWTSQSFPSQKQFYERFVRPQVEDGRKVFVIISDALRYEAGRELLEGIQRENRWKAEMNVALGSLPSFTQLGMASLLPHKQLEFDPRGQTILADGVSTAGTEARGKILAASKSGRATAITAEAFLALNSKTDGRDLSRGNDVVYIYHNAIDAVGDKRDTEHKTCAAVANAVDEIIKLLKKAAAMNVNHFVITSDHGFLYQNEPVAESDFLAFTEPPGTLKYDRRFVVAPSIPEDSRFKMFTSSQLGLAGDLTFAFPKGVQRLRLQGSGSRYVHGGTSLQEIVIPVIEVKKERDDNVGKVDVDILRAGQQITTGQVTVTFIQTDPIGDRLLPREVRAGFFSKTGVQLSETKIMKFDSSAEDVRQRERAEQFVFAKEADDFNQQEVFLRLEEQIPNTAQLSPYREFTFKLRRAFESDFDDF
jgi:uncharacterized protein (TIGR02687 family)